MQFIAAARSEGCSRPTRAGYVRLASPWSGAELRSPEVARDPPTVVVLDDWQDAIGSQPTLAALRDRVELRVYKDTAGSADELARRLAGAEIVIAVRERTRFDAAVFAARPPAPADPDRRRTGARGSRRGRAGGRPHRDDRRAATIPSWS